MKLVKTAPSSPLYIIAVGLTDPAPDSPPELEPQLELVKRRSLAISYLEQERSMVHLVGAILDTKVRGVAEVRRIGERTEVRIWVDHLPHPQTIGVNYTSYVTWVLVPDGPVENVGRLHLKGRSAEIKIAVPYQTFGLIVTAEPHQLVKHPGPTVVAENILDKHMNGRLVEYRGDPGLCADQSLTPTLPDYETPLCVLGARRAVEIAWQAGAGQHAKVELRQAESELGMLEQLWPEYLRNSRDQKLRNMSLEVMRMAERARATAADRSAAVVAKRRAERARQVEEAHLKIQNYLATIVRYTTDLVQTLNPDEQALAQAEWIEAGEELLRKA
ncbi:MAG TPA: hypothetical protein VJ302_07140 [Blastocatellia bacterium]|nr:hypothetical protein [Blastocatellia bacterium]